MLALEVSAAAWAREEDLVRARGLVDRQKSMIDKTEDFIRKNIAGQKTKQAQSRRKMLDKLEIGAVLERRFKAMDTNKDGVVSAVERSAAHGKKGKVVGDGSDS